LSKEVLTPVGNTPIIKLHNVVPDGGAEVWLKYEAGNPTGSYKDRMAMPVLANAMSRSNVSFGDTIVKFTGGSTGSSLAFFQPRLV
jgi:cysteine synthase A